MERLTKECLDIKTKEDLLEFTKECKEAHKIIELIDECKGRKGGVLSPYTQHIKECMSRFKSEYAGKPFGAAGQTMKKCAQEWRDKKKNA